MHDLFECLQRDHGRILQIVDTLANGPEEAEQTPPERKKLSDRLVIEASRHEAAEEQYLWPLVRRRLESGEEMARHAIGQESTSKRLLHDLDRISAGNTEFSTLVRQVFAEINDHVTYEESAVLPALRLKMTSEEAERYGELYRRAHRLGPTRPHPLTPPEPAILKVAGIAVATIDRARDAITGRGR